MENEIILYTDENGKTNVKEYDLLRQKELANLKSDFDLFLQDVSKIEKR